MLERGEAALDHDPPLHVTLGQDSQALRGQDSQAPRAQNSQAPRSLAGAKVTGPNTNKAVTLIREAEAACKAGDMKAAKAKAEAAITARK
jgi:hypothetical protein